MEFYQIGENVPLTVAFVITMILLLATSIMVIAYDTKRLSVKMWQLFLYVFIGFIGVIVGRLIIGDFDPILLICIPIYLVLNVLNSFFNKNRLIGQADVDILNGIITLAIPIIVMLLRQDYGDDNTSLVNNINVMEFGSNLVFWFIVGVVLSVGIFMVKLAVYNKKWRKLVIAIAIINVIGVGVSIYLKSEVISLIVLLISLIGIFIYSKLKSSGTTATIKAMYFPSGVVKKIEEGTDIKDGEELDTRTKMPVCVAFMPAYFFLVSFGMLAILH